MTIPFECCSRTIQVQQRGKLGNYQNITGKVYFNHLKDILADE